MGLEGRLGHVSVSAVWLDARAGDSRWVCGDNALSTGLRRNTAAMRELRCCCRGMRYGCFRWWRRSAARPACKRAASYGGARTGVASFCLGFAFGRPPRARARLETETCCLLKICLCCFKLHHPSRPPYPRHTPTSSSFSFAPRPKGLSIHSPLTQAPRCNQRALSLSLPKPHLQACRAHNVCAAWPPSLALPLSLPRAQKARGV